MESSVLAMFLFLFHGAAVSHAVLPPEIYWKTMLPDVPMPKAVKELLQPGNARKDVSDGAELDPNFFQYNAGKQPGANFFQYNVGKQSEPKGFGSKVVKELLQPGNARKDVSDGAELDPNFFQYNAGKQPGANFFQYNAGKQSEPKGFGSKVVKVLLQHGNARKDVSDGAELDPNFFQYNAGKQPRANFFQYNAGKHSEPNFFQYNAGKHSEPNFFQYNAGKQPGANFFQYNAGKQSKPKGFGSKVVKELLQPGNVGKDVSGGAELDHNTFSYIGGKHSEPNVYPYIAGKNSYPYMFDTESKAKVNDYDNIFFLEKELHPGSKINVHLARSTGGATFLPRQQADAIPFSSDMLSKVMEKLSVKPHSMEAKVMEQTIKTCEEPAQEGEEKYCATSLESMVDFVVYKLGKNVQSISTEVGKEETSRQQYTIGLEIKRIGGANSIVCHNQAYAYPVYYCHATHSTKVYVIPFFTTEGSTTKTIAVCHTDTSKWNPEHLAFQVLKIKPGTIPVCHFLPEGHIVWTSDETFA